MKAKAADEVEQEGSFKDLQRIDSTCVRHLVCTEQLLPPLPTPPPSHTLTHTPSHTHKHTHTRIKYLHFLNS